METHGEGTLLLVDDDAMNRDALSRRLQRKGYTVVCAGGGQEALDVIKAQRIDAVLLDVMMPGMSGIETLQRLREIRHVSELPVIMVTAKDDTADVVEALELGANDYVTKPINFATALARIRTQVTTRRADPLTGLANRVLFMDRLDRLLRSTAERPPFAVFFIDVDRFKLINDSLGHPVGDQLLIELAHRLQQCLRSTDTVTRFGGEHTLARLGGDEFTVIVENVPSVEDVRAIAERLLAVVAPPFALLGREIFASISIGMVMADPRYRQSGEMVRDADTAMYHAKAQGKARCELFDTSMLAAVQRRLELESDLRRALERRELRVYYQPIVALSGGALTGFEALVRWHHPERGVILPAEFIPTAEETGQIIELGSWVLEEACRQMVAWDQEFPEYGRLMVSVNLSARQCLRSDLVNEVKRILAATGLAPERLKFEVTESIVLENSETVSSVLHSLRALGVSLGLDDFGMGYSGLSYLQRYPFQTIKIDRAFIHGMQERGNTEIIRAIVSLAAGLAMNVTAEGIETAEQLSSLRDLACEFGQGFYFYRPLDSRDTHEILRTRKWPIVAA
jgi:diguanylate cyclase (GGDEF)-like protein